MGKGGPTLQRLICVRLADRATVLQVSPVSSSQPRPRAAILALAIVSLTMTDALVSALYGFAVLAMTRRIVPSGS